MKKVNPIVYVVIAVLTLVSVGFAVAQTGSQPVTIENYAEGGVVINVSEGSLGSDLLGGTSNFTSDAVFHGSITQNSPTSTENSVEVFTRYSAFNTDSSVLCALQSHPTATSTLVSGGLNFDDTSTTAMFVEFAKSSDPTATTTQIRTGSFAASAQGSLLAASTTDSALAQTNRIFSPGQWLVAKASGGIDSGTYSPTGACNASFRGLE